MSVVSLDRSTPLARKNHLCSSCGRVIAKGERYENQRNVYDGRAYTYKCCAHCQIATSRALTLSENYDEGIDVFWVMDTLVECAETVADLRMAVHMRKRWTRRDGSNFSVPKPTDPHTADADSPTDQAGTSGAQNHLDRSAT